MTHFDPVLLRAALRRRLATARGGQTLARALGVSRHSIIAILAGTAQRGTTEMVWYRAAQLGWLAGDDDEPTPPRAA